MARSLSSITKLSIALAIAVPSLGGCFGSSGSGAGYTPSSGGSSQSTTSGSSAGSTTSSASDGPISVPVSTWEGKWSTNFGPLVTEQKDGKLYGLYQYGENQIVGAIMGDLDGTNVMHFSWAEKNGAGKGSGVFVVAADGSEFVGTWGYGDSESDGGNWEGDRIDE